jgi:two-component system chemotaxis response regulator CheB
MTNRDIVAVGASAGGVLALRRMLGALPGKLQASLLVTQHMPEEGPNQLERILDNAGPLPAGFAVDGEVLERGRIYLAPPNRHLLLAGDRIGLGVGPRENGFRPALDPMFRSCVASGAAGRTIGVVLSGMLGDGAAGLGALQRHGGLAVIQDPADAENPEMPLNALRHVEADHTCPMEGLGPLVEELVSRPAAESLPASEELMLEVEIAAHGRATPTPMGRPSNLVCPECHGALGEIRDGDQLRYRCHSGHAYSAEALGLNMAEDVGRALASALRALQERALFFTRMAENAGEGQNAHLVRRYTARADEATRQAKVLQDLLVRQIRSAA